MRFVRVLSGVLAAFLVVAAWVRLAPADPARWHVDVASDIAPDCADGIGAARASARAACLSDSAAEVLLGRLDAIAMSTPRTRRLAGSPVEGRITWESRSRLMAFPDYTTAQARQTEGGARLDILARARFGLSDFGVNAMRMKAWLNRL
ncbi:MAG: DUF1499 domain-containing protein [Gemmobacter sp.]